MSTAGRSRSARIGVNLRGTNSCCLSQEYSIFVVTKKQKRVFKMEANSNKTKNIIEKRLSVINIKKLSKQSGFCKRKPKKIKPKKLLISLLLTLWNSKNNSYSSWAIKLGFLIKGTISKQAICKRMSQTLVEFLQSILKEIMEESVKVKIKENVSEKLKQFKRILIEDSTTIRLNDKLSKQYPGSRNKSKKEIAILKIQTTYDILKRRFIRFGITDFRKNDQAYSKQIFEVCKAGDLVIRDLGYFVLRVFSGLTQKGIFFLSRLSKTVSIYKEEEEKPIDLAKMLRKRGNLDAEFLIGETERVPIRIIAIPVEPEIAEQRRRKAKHNRDHRLNPSRKNLFLMGWNIFITNVDKEKLDAKEIEQLYSIRWRIEIIYKCWKTYMGITNVPQDGNVIRIQAFIYSMLIFILLFQVYFYEYYLNKFYKQKRKIISMMKFIQFIVGNISCVIQNEVNSISFKLLDKQIGYYCTYESRRDRINYNQLILKLS